MRMNLEVSKAVMISTTPARFLVAGSDRSPLNSERRPYDLNLNDP